MSAQAIGLGNGVNTLCEAPTGRHYLTHARFYNTFLLCRESRAAPLGLGSDAGGLRPRAALRLPWADIGLPLLGRKNSSHRLCPAEDCTTGQNCATPESVSEAVRNGYSLAYASGYFIRRFRIEVALSKQCES